MFPFTHFLHKIVSTDIFLFNKVVRFLSIIAGMSYNNYFIQPLKWHYDHASNCNMAFLQLSIASWAGVATKDVSFFLTHSNISLSTCPSHMTWLLTAFLLSSLSLQHHSYICQLYTTKAISNQSNPTLTPVSQSVWSIAGSCYHLGGWWRLLSPTVNKHAIRGRYSSSTTFHIHLQHLRIFIHKHSPGEALSQPWNTFIAQTSCCSAPQALREPLPSDLKGPS